MFFQKIGSIFSFVPIVHVTYIYLSSIILRICCFVSRCHSIVFYVILCTWISLFILLFKDLDFILFLYTFKYDNQIWSSMITSSGFFFSFQETSWNSCYDMCMNTITLSKKLFFPKFNWIMLSKSYSISWVILIISHDFLKIFVQSF